MTPLWADPEECDHTTSVGTLTIGRVVTRTVICPRCNTRLGYLRPIKRKR